MPDSLDSHHATAHKLEIFFEIPLTRGQVARVSAVDYSRLQGYVWHAQKNPRGQYYARRHFRAADGKRRNIQMHREILGLQDTSEPPVDHRNGNTLDNTRGNLRVANKSINAVNNHLRRAGKIAGFTAQNGGFTARIGFRGKTIYLGFFKTKEEAKRVYERKYTELFGVICV